jgi:hypothetical protein
MCFLGEFDEVTSMLAGASHPILHQIDSDLSLKISMSLTWFMGVPMQQRLVHNLREAKTWTGHLSVTYQRVVIPRMWDQCMNMRGRMDVSTRDTAWIKLTRSISANVTSGLPMADPYDCGWEDPSAAEQLDPGSSSGDRVDLYDCGWEDPMDVEMPGVQEDSNSLRWQDSSEKEGPSMVEEDAYDCGWEDPMEDQLTASVTTLGHQEDPYDCGWEAQPDDGAVIATSAPTPEHREDPYDCGWGDQPEDCVVPTTVISSVVPEDPYDCGWEDQMNADNAAPLADPDDPYDCGWDSPTPMCWQSQIGFKSPSRCKLFHMYYACR